MNAQLETRIIEQLHQLDERRLGKVLDFVRRQLHEKEKTPQFGNCKGMLTILVEDKKHCEWPLLDPARDFPRFAGTEPITEDGVAFQRHIRDTEWS
ncbi:conserved hypothetical protein [Gammaproteobacteria bacterium]